MLIVQLSDPHIVERHEELLGGIDTAAFFKAAIDHVEQISPRPDLVLVTGDLVNDGRPEQYAHLVDLLAPLTVPVALMPGNHDRVDALRAAFPTAVPDHHGRADGVVEGEVRVVMLDSSRFPEPGGDLDADQLDWLEHVLGAAPNAPTIVALHHPPFATGITHMDAMALSATASAGLEAVIGRHPQVERVVCGHIHRSVIRRFGGTIAQVCPGTAHAVQLDLADRPPALNLEPPALLLHRWDAEEGFVTHLEIIGDHHPVTFAE